jgi:hypothetical protein
MKYLKQINKEKNSYKNINNLRLHQCPICFIIMEKNEKSNYIKCINCNQHSCWLCKEPCSNNHFNFYNITGCPLMRYGNFKIKIYLMKFYIFML